jgi:hypothetical protein
MQTFEHKRVLVTGGSRGLGLGVVEALVARHADVSILAGDATDPALAELVLRDVRTSVLVLNAGTMPTMVPLDAHTWESFSSNWNTDVKATFHWVQAALRFAAREWEPRAALLEWGRTGRLAALRVVARAVVDPIGLGGMRSERPRPSLRILVAGSAREARRVRRDHVHQAQDALEANLGQAGAFQLGAGHKPRFQSATANRFHKSTIFVSA